jgi:hypothetical protein
MDLTLALPADDSDDISGFQLHVVNVLCVATKLLLKQRAQDFMALTPRRLALAPHTAIEWYTRDTFQGVGLEAVCRYAQWTRRWKATDRDPDQPNELLDLSPDLPVQMLWDEWQFNSAPEIRVPDETDHEYRHYYWQVCRYIYFLRSTAELLPDDFELPVDPPVVPVPPAPVAEPAPQSIQDWLAQLPVRAMSAEWVQEVIRPAMARVQQGVDSIPQLLVHYLGHGNWKNPLATALLLPWQLLEARLQPSDFADRTASLQELLDHALQEPPAYREQMHQCYYAMLYVTCPQVPLELLMDSWRQQFMLYMRRGFEHVVQQPDGSSRCVVHEFFRRAVEYPPVDTLVLHESNDTLLSMCAHPDTMDAFGVGATVLLQYQQQLYQLTATRGLVPFSSSSLVPPEGCLLLELNHPPVWRAIGRNFRLPGKLDLNLLWYKCTTTAAGVLHPIHMQLWSLRVDATQHELTPHNQWSMVQARYYCLGPRLISSDMRMQEREVLNLHPPGTVVLLGTQQVHSTVPRHMVLRIRVLLHGQPVPNFVPAVPPSTDTQLAELIIQLSDTTLQQSTHATLHMYLPSGQRTDKLPVPALELACRSLLMYDPELRMMLVRELLVSMQDRVCLPAPTTVDPTPDTRLDGVLRDAMLVLDERTGHFSMPPQVGVVAAAATNADAASIASRIVQYKSGGHVLDKQRTVWSFTPNYRGPSSYISRY